MTATANSPRRASTRRLASIADAADYAACSGKTIRRRIADGTIRAYRLGKRSVRVDLDDGDGALREIPTASAGRAARTL
jgi:excisionase family DNA binding protein